MSTSSACDAPCPACDKFAVEHTTCLNCGAELCDACVAELTEDGSLYCAKCAAKRPIQCDCGERFAPSAARYRGADVTPGLYVLLFACPCGSTRALRMWFEPDEFDALIDDSEPIFSAARDARREDSCSRSL